MRLSYKEKKKIKIGKNRLIKRKKNESSIKSYINKEIHKEKEYGILQTR